MSVPKLNQLLVGCAEDQPCGLDQGSQGGENCVCVSEPQQGPSGKASTGPGEEGEQDANCPSLALCLLSGGTFL